MLVIALVLALIGLVALVFAVVTSNELVAWVCIGASVLGVLLLIIDAVRERQQREVGQEIDDEAGGGDAEEAYVDYPEDVPDQDESGVGAGVHDDAGAEAAEESTVPADGDGKDPAE